MNEQLLQHKELIENSHLSEDVFIAALKAGIALEDVEESYQGKHNSDVEFVREMLFDVDASIINEIPSYMHIDWEATARDVMYDYTEQDGHYFRNI